MVMDVTMGVMDITMVQAAAQAAALAVFEEEAKEVEVEVEVTEAELVVEEQEETVDEPQQDVFNEAKPRLETREVPWNANDIIESWLANPERLFAYTQFASLLEAYNVMCSHSADCERTGSALVATCGDKRAALKPDMIEMLLQIKLNGPDMLKFDFAAAVDQYLAIKTRNIRASKATTSTQKAAAKHLAAYKFGDCDIPQDIMDMVSKEGDKENNTRIFSGERASQEKKNTRSRPNVDMRQELKELIRIIDEDDKEAAEVPEDVSSYGRPRVRSQMHPLQQSDD